MGFDFYIDNLYFHLITFFYVPIELRNKQSIIIIFIIFIGLVYLIYGINMKNEIDAESWTVIEEQYSTSQSEFEKRQLMILIMFQQVGLVLGIFLIPLSILIYHLRSSYMRLLRRMKRGFKISPLTDESPFIQKLLRSFPILTVIDTRLCQLLMDCLSSKQIALELNITPSSVNTARYRLRKKMNLRTDEDLITFLYQI